MDKKSQFNLVLNTVTQTDDPTVLNATFIIHDFEQSWNGQIISKEVALENIHTLKNKPILAKYYPAVDGNTSTDALGTHEQYIGVNRYGEQVLKMDTIPIGVITTEGYLLTMGEKEVIAVDAVLWSVRYSDVCNLLLEWYQRGIKIVSSVEYLYQNYTFKDGVEYIQSPIYFDGHCVLNSEQRGDHEKVLPAYDSSQLLSFNDLKQFNRLVAQAINQNKKEESESMLFKKVCELSHSDIRTKIYQVLDPTLPEGTYSWIVDTYDDHFIVELDTETDVQFYQYNYSKTDTGISIDFESKVEVIEERKWVTQQETVELQNQVNESNQKVQELTETVTSLNTKVKELEPYREQVEAAQLEQALNEQKDFYEGKFDAVNALDKFESEEVQSLIKASINKSDEGKDAKLQLNSILIDCVKPKEQKNNEFRESANQRGKLIDIDNDFKSRYSI